MADSVWYAASESFSVRREELRILQKVEPKSAMLMRSKEDPCRILVHEPRIILPKKRLEGQDVFASEFDGVRFGLSVDHNRVRDGNAETGQCRSEGFRGASVDVGDVCPRGRHSLPRGG